MPSRLTIPSPPVLYDSSCLKPLDKNRSLKLRVYPNPKQQQQALHTFWILHSFRQTCVGWLHQHRLFLLEEKKGYIQSWVQKEWTDQKWLNVHREIDEEISAQQEQKNKINKSKINKDEDHHHQPGHQGLASQKWTKHSQQQNNGLKDKKNFIPFGLTEEQYRWFQHPKVAKQYQTDRKTHLKDNPQLSMSSTDVLSQWLTKTLEHSRHRALYLTQWWFQQQKKQQEKEGAKAKNKNKYDPGSDFFIHKRNLSEHFSHAWRHLSREQQQHALQLDNSVFEQVFSMEKEEVNNSEENKKRAKKLNQNLNIGLNIEEKEKTKANGVSRTEEEPEAVTQAEASIDDFTLPPIHHRYLPWLTISRGFLDQVIQDLKKTCEQALSSLSQKKQANQQRTYGFPQSQKYNPNSSSCRQQVSADKHSTYRQAWQNNQLFLPGFGKLRYRDNGYVLPPTPAAMLTLSHHASQWHVSFPCSSFDLWLAKKHNLSQVQDDIIELRHTSVYQQWLQDQNNPNTLLVETPEEKKKRLKLEREEKLKKKEEKNKEKEKTKNNKVKNGGIKKEENSTAEQKNTTEDNNVIEENNTQQENNSPPHYILKPLPPFQKIFTDEVRLLFSGREGHIKKSYFFPTDETGLPMMAGGDAGVQQLMYVFSLQHNQQKKHQEILGFAQQKYVQKQKRRLLKIQRQISHKDLCAQKKVQSVKENKKEENSHLKFQKKSFQNNHNLNQSNQQITLSLSEDVSAQKIIEVKKSIEKTKTYLSHRRLKAQLLLQKKHARLIRQQDAYLKQQAEHIASHYAIFCSEDLSLKHLMRKENNTRYQQKNISENKRLEEGSKNKENKFGKTKNNKKLFSLVDFRYTFQSQALGKFYRYLEDKMKQRGHLYLKVDRYFPSTQMCSACYQINPKVKGRKNVHVKEWTCSSCKTHFHRDGNAAHNILRMAIQEYLIKSKTQEWEQICEYLQQHPDSLKMVQQHTHIQFALNKLNKKPSKIIQNKNTNIKNTNTNLDQENVSLSSPFSKKASYQKHPQDVIKGLSIINQVKEVLLEHDRRYVKWAAERAVVELLHPNMKQFIERQGLQTVFQEMANLSLEKKIYL